MFKILSAASLLSCTKPDFSVFTTKTGEIIRQSTINHFHWAIHYLLPKIYKNYTSPNEN